MKTRITIKARPIMMANTYCAVDIPSLNGKGDCPNNHSMYRAIQDAVMAVIR